MPRAPAPRRLPRALRSTLADRLDGMMVAVAAVSLLAHVGLVAYLRGLDFPRTPDIEALPLRVATVWRAPPPSPSPPAAAPARVPIAQSTSRTHRVHSVAHAGAARPSLREQLARSGLLSLVHARGEGGLGTTDLLARGAPPDDADRVFGQLGSVTTDARGGTGLVYARDGGGGARARGIEGMRGEAPELVRSGDRGDEHGAPEVQIERPVPRGPGPVPPIEELSLELRRRARAFRACYERSLHRDPRASGKIELRFRIGAGGFVDRAEVQADELAEPGLAACLIAVLERTPFPPGFGGAEIAVPFVFVTR